MSNQARASLASPTNAPHGKRFPAFVLYFSIARIGFCYYYGFMNTGGITRLRAGRRVA